MKGCCNLDAHFITAATFSASFPFPSCLASSARNNALLSRRKKPMKETGMCVHASLSSVEQRRARVERGMPPAANWHPSLLSPPSVSGREARKVFFGGGRRRSGSRPEKTDRSAATLSRTDGGLLIFSAAERRGGSEGVANRRIHCRSILLWRKRWKGGTGLGVGGAGGRGRLV